MAIVGVLGLQFGCKDPAEPDPEVGTINIACDPDTLMT